MLPIKGIFQNFEPSAHPEGFAFDIRNGVVWKSVLQNEEGTVLFSSYFEENEMQVIGILPVNELTVVFSIKGDTDEIGILDKDGNYTTKLQWDLGFNIEYPIDAEAQYNYKNELVVAFTDGLNTPKVLNLDDIPDPFHVRHIEMFPSAEEVILQTEVIDGGGSLRSGSYQLYTRYIDKDNTRLDAQRLTNPIFITTSNQSDNIDTFTGVEANTVTNKAIGITLTNVNTSYKAIVIGVLAKIDGIFQSYELPIIYLSALADSVYYIFTGNEDIVDITFEEVLQTRTHYKTVKHITQVEGALYGASVEEYEHLNLQSIANQVKLKWVARLENVHSMADSDKLHENNHSKRPFAHGEVYAMYLKAKLKRGGWTQAFHIPGRAAELLDHPVNSIPGVAIMENDLNSEIRAAHISHFPELSRDIEINQESKYFQTRDTTKGLVGTGGVVEGEFGLWENENEVYPNTDEFSGADGGEDLRGKKVRHFRFPSQTKMMSYYISAPEISSTIKANYQKVYKDALSFKIDFFPEIPEDLLNEIEGFEIMYAERNAGNSTIVGEGPIVPSLDILEASPYSQRLDHRTLTWSSGGAFDVKLHPQDPHLGIVDFAKLRLYSMDLLYYKSAVLPNYVEAVYSYAINNTGSKKTDHFLGTQMLDNEDPTTRTITHGWRFLISSGLGELANDDVNIAPITNLNAITKLNDVMFIPQNVTYKERNNLGAEEFVSAEVADNRKFYPTLNSSYTMIPATMQEPMVGYYYGVYGVYKIFKTNLYTNFYNQKLISTGHFFKPENAESEFYGGDVFIGVPSLVLHGTLFRLVDDPRFIRSKFVLNFISETRMNTNFRHEDLTIPGSKFYPKEGLPVEQGNNERKRAYVFQYKDETKQNHIAYNNDYSSIGNVNTATVFNPYKDDYVDEDLFKIIRSLVPNPEQRNPSWRDFKANDYYIIPRNKGIITNITGFGNHLFINTSYSLFITTGHEVMATDSSEVAVGTGNIFARSLRELILDDKGYTGCQHKFSCLLTPTGYFFVDVDKGRIFLASSEGVSDIGHGLTEFFRNNLYAEGDNPFNKKGFTLAWDDKHSRLILSQLNGNRFTVSLSTHLQSWISFHDYYPDYLFFNRKNIFGLLDNKTYEFNKGPYGTYFDEEAKPFYIVSVINEGNYVNKILDNIRWATRTTLEGKEIPEVTFDSLLIWNTYQSTGNQSINVFSLYKAQEDNFAESNTRLRDRYYNFNSLRDLTLDNSLPFIDGVSSIESNIKRDKPVQYQQRLNDLFFMYKLLFNNDKIINLQGGEEIPKIELIDIDYLIRPV